VREGQKIVCKWLYVDTVKAKHHIDLSLNGDVNETPSAAETRSRNGRTEQKADEKWIGYVAKTTKMKTERSSKLTDLFYEKFAVSMPRFKNQD